MSDPDAILWKGKPAEDLTREEAIEAFKQTFRTLYNIMELKRMERGGRYERVPAASDTPIADAYRADRVRRQVGT